MEEKIIINKMRFFPVKECELNVEISLDQKELVISFTPVGSNIWYESHHKPGSENGMIGDGVDLVLTMAMPRLREEL